NNLIDEEVDTEGEGKDDDEEVEFVNPTMPLAEVRKVLKQTIEILPLNTETDFEIKRAMVKQIRETDSEIIRTACRIQ
ncbi:hypothetical protein, partial, partial [Absidia glauca]